MVPPRRSGSFPGSEASNILSPRSSETGGLGVKMVEYVLSSSPNGKDLEPRMRGLVLVSTILYGSGPFFRRPVVCVSWYAHLWTFCATGSNLLNHKYINCCDATILEGGRLEIRLPMDCWVGGDLPHPSRSATQYHVASRLKSSYTPIPFWPSWPLLSETLPAPYASTGL
jgi:hypothetical protein